jgi:hypothetical protein
MYFMGFSQDYQHALPFVESPHLFLTKHAYILLAPPFMTYLALLRFAAFAIGSIAIKWLDP